MYTLCFALSFYSLVPFIYSFVNTNRIGLRRRRRRRRECQDHPVIRVISDVMAPTVGLQDNQAICVWLENKRSQLQLNKLKKTKTQRKKV